MTQPSKSPCCCKKKSASNVSAKEIRHHALRAGVGLFFIVLTLLTSFIGLSPLLIILISALNSIVTIFIGWDSYTEVFSTFYQNFFSQSAPSSDPSSTKQKQGSLTVDALFVLSASTALIASTLNLIFPQLGIGAMYNAALIIFTSRHLGQYFIKTVSKEINDIPQLQSLAPEQVLVPNAQGINANAILNTIPKQVTALSVNEVFCFQAKTSAGDEYILPVNCKIYKDDIITVNYKYITDNDQYQSVDQEAILKAGTIVKINQDKIFSTLFQVQARLQDSYLATSESLLNNRPLITSPTMQWLEHVTNYLIPMVLGIAFVTGIVIGYICSPVLGLITAINILTSVCPCILGLIPGLMAKIGVYKGQNIGIQFASGAALEKFAQIDAVVFDLNGTLTDGKINVTIKDTLDAAVKPVIAALKEINIHPVCQAISSTISDGIDIMQLPKITDVQKVTGGISFTVVTKNSETLSYLMGNYTLMQKNNIQNISQAEQDQIYLYCKEQNSGSWQKKGSFICQTALRPTAQDVVGQLNHQGKEIYICTGANNIIALTHAQSLGIDFNNVRYDQSAQDKFNYIQELRSGGKTKVAVIGNGLNDLPAIMHSDCGIYLAIDQNAELTAFLQPRADATISEDQFSGISTAMQLCQDLVSKTKWLIILSLSYNTIMVAIGITLPLLGIAMIPALGALAMVGQAAWVSLYCYYIYRSQSNQINQPPTGIAVNNRS